MNQTLITTTADKELEEVETQLKKEHIHYLPVLTDGKIVGVVTLADVLALHLNREQSVESDLESYIYGVTRPKF
jgi:predicted transcriptional regulator